MLGNLLGVGRSPDAVALRYSIRCLGGRQAVRARRLPGGGGRNCGPDLRKVGCIFRTYGIGGATIGELAARVRDLGLFEGSLPAAKRIVKLIVAEWGRSHGRTHRELEEISHDRYRAVFNDR